VTHGYGPDDPGRPGGGQDHTRRIGDDPDATRRITGGPAGGGRVLGGRYRLEGLLGTGGMSEVHRGTDLRLDRPVAVKLFRAGTDRDSLRRFTDEAHTLANLSHPGLVSVYDSGAERDQPYLVMELVSGWSLQEVMQQEELPLDEVRRIGASLADVLAYVHQQGVVHGDVKPSNILVGRDNRVRLADFGTARPVQGEAPGFGTPAYLSPEQVRGEWVGPPADVYALGLVLLEAVTGRVEFPGRGREAAAARLERSPEVPADLPGGLREALLAMTDPDPKERPTASQSAGMLERDDAPAPAAVMAEPVQNNATRQILVIALGALLLAGLIGFVAFATSDDDTSKTSASSSTSATATRTPTTTKKTTATTAPDDDTTTTTTTRSTRTTTASPTSGIALPDVNLPDVSLPDTSDVESSVVDGVKKAWAKFTDWLSGLAG
jgi:eukaryotic-like serine/threonine-protein kinase